MIPCTVRRAAVDSILLLGIGGCVRTEDAVEPDYRLEGREPMPTVLVVDDDALVRWVIRSALESVFDVVEAQDGYEALEAAGCRKFDLVLSDLKMEGMDGLSLIEELRRRGIAAKILILTAYETEDVDRRAFRLGVAGVLRKPIDLLSLYEVARSHVDFSPAPIHAPRITTEPDVRITP